MTGRCAYCGGRAVERDHLTGRAGPGSAPYFDPELWVPCCRHCNTANAHDWRTLRLLGDVEVTEETRSRRLAYSARRVAGGPCTWAPPASWWDGLARLAVDLAGPLPERRP